MANGDAAAAAGLPVVAATSDIRQGYGAINAVSDAVANHQTNGTHAWSKVTGKPALAPANHTHQASSIPTTGSNVQADIDYVNGRATQALAETGDLNLRVNTAQGTANNANANANSRALSYGGNASQVRHAEGPTASAYNRNAGSNRFAVYMDGDLNFGRSVSSKRYKADIKKAKIDPESIYALEPVTYRMKGDTGSAYELGLVAEDVYEVLPEVVQVWDRDEDGKKITPVIESIDYAQQLTVALIVAIKDQNEKIKALEERIKKLETKSNGR